MFEIRLHGLGGEGVVSFSEFIGKAAMACGKWAHSFPFFGTEIRGAAVKAFTRVSDEPIHVKSYIYEPDMVAVTNDLLLDDPQTLAGLGEDGLLLVNTPRAASDVAPGRARVLALDATAMGQELLGRPIANTVMAGALVRATGILPLEAVLQVVRSEFPTKLAGLNVEAVQAGYDLAGRMP